MGFEPSVSPKIDRAFEIALSPLRHSRSARETGSFCERDRRFESAFSTGESVNSGIADN